MVSRYYLTYDELWDAVTDWLRKQSIPVEDMTIQLHVGPDERDAPNHVLVVTMWEDDEEAAEAKPPISHQPGSRQT